MKPTHRWSAVILLSLGLHIAGCKHSSETASSEEDVEPAKVEHLDGVAPTRVTLTEDAARRLGIETDTVRDTTIDGSQRWVVPYAAVLYDTVGDTWTYMNSAPLVYDRRHIAIDYIIGDQVIVSAGPPAGSRVVRIGAAELYGSEVEFEEE